MNKHLLLCAAGMLLLHGAAHAKLTKVASNGTTGVDVYVDPGFEQLNKARGLLRVNLVSTHSKDLEDGRKKGTRTAVTALLDCKDKTLAIEKLIKFSANGAVETSIVYPPERIRTDKLSEGTLMWTMQDVVCSIASAE